MAENTVSFVEPSISAVVLAGGQSKRLGQDKSLLVVDGQPLITRTVARLEALSDDLIVVTNSPDRYEPQALPVRFVPDERRGVGALMGVYSGLRAARYSHALVVACDMPFLNASLLRYMLSLVIPQPPAEHPDVIIPRIDGLLEPLHAVYNKACLPVMERLLEKGCRKIIAFFPDVQVRYVEDHEIDKFDPLRLSFVNVNTQEDWLRVRELMGEVARS
jgi:molybdopterin-guanine dinucleotide biosynthesis protein A